MGRKRILDDRYRWILQFLKPYVWIIAAIIVVQFIQNYAYTMLPSVGAGFIYDIIRAEQLEKLYHYFPLGLGIIVLKGILSYVSSYTLSVVSENAVKNLRRSFFHHLISLPLHFFKRNKTGNFISMIIDDTMKIRTNLYEGIVRVCSQVIYIIIVIVRLMLLNSVLTLASFAVIPIMYLFFHYIGKKVRSTSQKLQQNVANMSTNLHETLTAVDVVKTFANEEYEGKRFDRTAIGYKRTALKLKVFMNLIKPLNELIIFFFAFALIAIASIFITRNLWSGKELIEYIILLGLLANPINNLPKTLANFKIVSASVDRVYSVIQVDNSIVEPPVPTERKIEGHIGFHNVSFAYNGTPVLRGLDFAVEKGEVVALVGSSGVGKTTAVNLIPRFYDPQEGKVTIDGIDVREYGIKNLRSQIGIVSQNVALFNETVYENIRYSKLDAGKDDIVEAAKKAHAYEFISNLPDGFDTVVGERGTRLSGGEKQRISIARTVLINPHILILDEATSALDSESEHYIQLALNDLMKGKTSVVIAHRLSTISHATKILVIENGRVDAMGTHDELLQKNEIYRRLYTLQYFR